ncbi:hypothetical protein FDECE_8539 [Fusarium decemcellulare]|nr:hypothetical protein FDECE_8539 [Fusarium decemcellulare]
MALWLFRPDLQITKAGSSNFFVTWRNAACKMELVTSPGGDCFILPGVARQSVLTLARERMSENGATIAEGIATLEVSERPFAISDLAAAQDEGRLVASLDKFRHSLGRGTMLASNLH